MPAFSAQARLAMTLSTMLLLASPLFDELAGMLASLPESKSIASGTTRSITGPKLRFGFPFSVPLPTSTAMTRYLAVPSARETGMKNTRAASGGGAPPSQTIFTT